METFLLKSFLLSGADVAMEINRFLRIIYFYLLNYFKQQYFNSSLENI